MIQSPIFLSSPRVLYTAVRLALDRLAEKGGGEEAERDLSLSGEVEELDCIDHLLVRNEDVDCPEAGEGREVSCYDGCHEMCEWGE